MAVTIKTAAPKKKGRPKGSKNKKPSGVAPSVALLKQEKETLEQQLAKALSEIEGLKSTIRGAQQVGNEFASGVAGLGESVDGLQEDAIPPLLQQAINEEGTGIVNTGTLLTEERIFLRRKQVLRLLLRGVPRLTISQQLKIPLSTLKLDIAAIKAEITKGLDTYDLQYEVGMTMNFYDECKTVALRIATDPATKKNIEKTTALRMAMDAETAKQRFLASLGLYAKRGIDELGFASSPDEGNARDGHELLALFEGVLHGVHGG
jgi:hypothetical protein